LFFIHIKIAQLLQHKDLKERILELLDHHLIALILLLDQLVLVNFRDLDSLDLVLQSEIFVNQMPRKRILKQQKEERNINFHFSQMKKKTSIHFVVKKVSSEVKR
jgi:hypothetical protein